MRWVLAFVIKQLFWAILMVAVITLITFVIFILVPADQTTTRLLPAHSWALHEASIT